jgi:lycopene beta-cyclase
MARGKRDGLLIAGGGLAGCLAALALAKQRPEVPLLLVEETERFGGNHVWSFLEPEVDEEHRWLIDPMISMSWPGYYVSFPGHSRKLSIPCHSIRSEDLDRIVRETLRPDQYRLGTKVVAVRENELGLPGGEAIRADAAIDARGFSSMSMIALGWRKFVGREFQFSRPHRVDLPVMIDATVDQLEGYHFVYCLPLSEDRLLVEDTYFSETPDLDKEKVRGRIDAYLALRGWKGGVPEREESGVLPIALSDDVHAFWRGSGARVAKLGVRGGFFHPSTGYSLADAVRTAMLLVEQRDYSGPTLHDLFESEVGQLWKKREFFRVFNEALFDAPAWERRQIMGNLYELDGEILARFYAGRLGVLDRMKISAIKTSGKAAR